MQNALFLIDIVIVRSIHLQYRSEPLTKGVPSAPGDTAVTGDHREIPQPGRFGENQF